MGILTRTFQLLASLEEVGKNTCAFFWGMSGQAEKYLPNCTDALLSSSSLSSSLTQGFATEDEVITSASGKDDFSSNQEAE